MGIKLPDIPPCKLAISAIVVSFLTCFQATYHLSIINNPQTLMESFVNQSYYAHYGRYLQDVDLSLLWGAIVSVLSLGSMIGSLMTSYFGERFGRRLSLFVTVNVIAIIANLCMGFSMPANSFELLLFGRLLIGFAGGLQGGLLALYLSESSPTKFRGVVGSLQNVFFGVIGVIAAAVTLPETAIDIQTMLPYLLGAGAIPALLQLVLCPLFPETPKYLYLHRRDPERATRSVLFYYGEKTDVSTTFAEFTREEETSSGGQMGFVQAFRHKQIRQGIVLSMVVNAAMIATGIVVIQQFSTRLFEQSGLSGALPMQMTTVVLAVNAASAIVFAPFMDSFGRRLLLLSSLIIIIACNIIFVIFSNVDVEGAAVVCLVSVLVNMVAFSLGPGPIAWIIIGELTPQCARSVAVSMAATANIGTGWIVSLIFPSLMSAIETYSLLTCVVACVACTLWLYLRLPETKNRPVDEIFQDVLLAG